jgi:hypothetical protein
MHIAGSDAGAVLWHIEPRDAMSAKMVDLKGFLAADYGNFTDEDCRVLFPTRVLT